MKVLKTFYTAGDLSDSINASYENTYDVVNRLVQQEILSYYYRGAVLDKMAK